MSFRELGGRPTHRAVDRTQSLPKVRVTNLTSPPNNRRPRPIALHGRLVRSEAELRTKYSEETTATASSVESIRDQLKRKSEFAQLTSHAKHFQKLVADLEHVLREAGESPEAAWRAKILTKSARETSESLWKSLYAYETSLKNKQQSGVRTAQTACLKLHRDIKRTQKTFVMCLSKHEQQQQAEISMLGAVGWTGPEDSDIFDRKMKEKELERMNQSMHQVHDLYQELAGMVHEQQEQIDHVDDEIVTAKANVEAGARSIHCANDSSFLCGAANCVQDDPVDGFDRSISIGDDDETLLLNGCGDWYNKPMESINDGIEAVKGFHRELVLVGKDILGNPEADDEQAPLVVASSSSQS